METQKHSYGLVLGLHDRLQIEGHVLYDHSVLLHAGLRFIVPANERAEEIHTSGKSAEAPWTECSPRSSKYRPECHASQCRQSSVPAEQP